MIEAGIVGLGWWGKNIVNAVQGKTDKLAFVHGVSKEIDAALPFAEKHGFRLSAELDAVLDDPARQGRRAGDAAFAPCRADRAHRAGRKAGHLREAARAETQRCGTRRRRVPARRRADRRGQNKRFWPSMEALRAVVASGVLGKLMHVEGHYSNENSTSNFASWRALQTETPGAGMTGTGIHILDAFVNLAGRWRMLRRSSCPCGPTPIRATPYPSCFRSRTG